MLLRVCNSGSKGNGYILENETEALLIEAGCKFSEIKQMLDFNISKIQGMVISHKHG